MYQPPSGSRDQVGRVAGDAVGAQAQQAMVKGLVVGGNHAALAGGNVLHGVEAEDGQVGKLAVAAALLPALRVDEKAAGRVAGIFDNPEAKLVGQLAGRFQIHGQPGKIDRNQAREIAFGVGFEQGPHLCKSIRPVAGSISAKCTSPPQ